MTTHVPIIRQTSWLAAAAQLVAMSACVAIAYGIGGRKAALWGAFPYLIYSFGSRLILLRAHRAGMGLIKQQRFTEAIAKFQESVAFLDRHPWIDDYRSIELMTPAAMSYREMGLANIGFCYVQLVDVEQSRVSYLRCLDRYPECGMAQSALRFLDSASEVNIGRSSQ